jgi:hypothetical protein
VLHTYSARALAIVGDIDRDGCREVLVARAVESLEPAGTVDIPVGHWDAQGNKSATSYMHIPEDHIRRSAFLYISTVHAVDPITTGQIELHSGRTGEVLRVSERIDEYIRHPCRVGDAGDVDADAVHDWWVLAGGRVAIYSGANGSLSFSIGPVADCEPLSVAAGQDVNGDGCADVVVGHSWIRGEGVGPRAVRVYSGASGKLLWSYVAATTRPSEEFADEVAFAGDVDGDRCSDVLVTYRDTFGRSGVLLLSGRNGKLIRDFGEPDNGCLPRFDVLGGLDYDVDSIPDLFFVVLDNEGWCSRANSIEVRSGRTGAWIDTIR